jgi:Gpi18-like mannosyltransferase
MEVLQERAELQTAPASNQTDPGSNSVDPAAMLHTAPVPMEQAWPGLCVVIAAIIALLLKVVIAFNTFGSNDVISFYQFAQSLGQHGLEQTYRANIAFNHPPLIAHYLDLIYKISRQSSIEENGITFPLLLRLPGIVADFVVVCALLALRKRAPRLRIPTWALFLLAVSPVSLMVSGFHGNTDSIMVMFLVLAACQCVRNQPIWCGIFLALSCQIKIVPLLCLPVFFFFWLQRRSLLSFVLPLILTTLIFWSEPLFHYPLAFAKNVFGYGSFWGLWGITYWMRQTGWSEFSRASFYGLSPAQNLIVSLLKLTIIAAVIMLAWRRRKMASGRALFASLAYTWVIFFVLSPGIGAQYLVWSIPFILVLSPQFYALFMVGSSLFLFFFYNTICRGLPWYGGMSNGDFKIDWTPWSIWPWAILIVAAVLLWKQGRRDHPSLRLLSLEAVRD